MKNSSICIVGAGLTGSLLSIFLGKRGFKVKVFEKRNDFRQNYDSSKRSIAMSISARGLLALRQAGLEQEILNISIPTIGRAIHDIEGGAKCQNYGSNEQAIYTIERRELNHRLIDAASKMDNIEFYFNHELIDLNLEDDSATFLNGETGEAHVEHFDKLFGVDGVFSRVRKFLEEKTNFETILSEFPMGFKEITMPSKQKSHALDNKYVHFWTSPPAMLIALPNYNKTIVSTFFNLNEGPQSFAEVKDQESVDHLFKTRFPDLLELIPDLTQQYIENPQWKIYGVNCPKWNYENKILLMGDAAHAIPPFYAMGMNTCFEDCYILNARLDASDGNLDEIFESFTEMRKADTDAISEMSTRNFNNIIQADKSFDIKWKLERQIWQKLPTIVPEYVMVAFQTVSMSKILELTDRRSYIVNKYIDQYGSNVLEDHILFSALGKELESLDYEFNEYV